MALTFVLDTNPAASATSATPLAPAAGAVQAGDHALVVVVNKRAGFTPATPAGWQLVTSVQVGTGSAGAEAGLLRISLFAQDVPDPTTWTMPSFAVSGTGAVISAGLMVWRTAPGETLTYSTTSGSDTVAGTAWSVTGGTVLPLNTGDVLLALAAITSNNPNLSAAALSAPGATLGALNNPWSSSSGVGDTLRSVAYRAPVTAGASTGAPVMTATASTSTAATGGALFVRLHVTTGAVRTATGGAAGRAAGGGPRWRVKARSGSAAPTAAGSGSRGTLPGRSGGAVARAAGHGPKRVSSSQYIDTYTTTYEQEQQQGQSSSSSPYPSTYTPGYGTAPASWSYPSTYTPRYGVPPAAVIDLTGGASARLSGSGSSLAHPPATRDASGGAVTRALGTSPHDVGAASDHAGGVALTGAGSGGLDVVTGSIIDLTGGAAGHLGVTGQRDRPLADRSGGVTLRMAAGGDAVSVYQMSGGAGARPTGVGQLDHQIIPRAKPRTDPLLLATLDVLTCGGQFDGRAPVIDDVEYVLTGLTGWWGSPATRTGRVARLGAAGAHRRPTYKDTRAVEVTVTATSQARDPQAMRQVERVLAATCSDPDRLYPLQVADQAGATCAYVELDGAVAHQARDGLGWSSVIAIPVVAPDPRRFAPAWTSASTGPPVTPAGGIDASAPGVAAVAPGIAAGTSPRPAQVTVTGRGTAARLPLVFQISGAAQDITIVADGQTSVLGYRGVLADDDTVWINVDDQPAHDVPGAPDTIPARGALLANGANARSAVTRFGAWPRLRPGDVVTFAVSGDFEPGAQLTVHTRDAFA